MSQDHPDRGASESRSDSAASDPSSEAWWLQTVLDASSDAIISVDRTGRIKTVNRAMEQLFGIDAGEAVGQIASVIASQEPLEERQALIRGILAGGVVRDLDVVRYHRDGTPLPIRLSAHPVRSPSGEIVGVVAVVRDRRPELVARSLIDNSIDRERAILNAIPDLVFVVDRTMHIQHYVANDPNQLARPGHELVGRHVRDIGLPDEVAERALTAFAQTIETGAIQTFSYTLDVVAGARHFEARVAPFGDRGVMVVARDVTERIQSQDERLRHVQELERLAERDTMTNLLNSRALRARLAVSMSLAAASESTGAVVYLDLDGFKAINDTFGHATGDDVISTIAGRIETCLRRGDIAARIGGDEFAVVLVDIDRVGACIVADKLLHAVREPLRVGGQDRVITTSVGVAWFDGTESSPGTVISAADRAMYAAKRAGGDRVQCVDGANKAGTATPP